MARLLFVIGKGGVGKTTLTAALGQCAAHERRRTLLVEVAGDGTLAALFGRTELPTEPVKLHPGLHGVRIEPRALIDAYFRRLLRLPFLSGRLFASNTFWAVTAAAPGVTEFVVLEHLLRWTEPGRLTRRAPYDVVVVDGPATGHALRLLRTPRQLASMVPGGPIAGTLRRLVDLLADGARTRVLLVAIPDEMAVTEALEARATLRDGLQLHLARPVLNRVWPRRFSAADARVVLAGSTGSDDPLLAAARLQIGFRAEAERHLRRLRQAFGAAPIDVHEQCGGALGPVGLEAIGRPLVRALFAA